MVDFRHGTPLMVDHTPGSDVTAGDVIVVGDQPLVAHVDIKSGEKGALGARNGVYRGPADGAISGGVKVYWSGTQFTTTSTSNKQFGFVTPDSSSAQADDLIEVIHAPDVGG